MFQYFQEITAVTAINLDKISSVRIGFAPVMRTYVSKEPKTRKWVVVDLKDQPLGRVATKIADILRGKDKADFTHHVDTGSFVVAINAGKVKFTGKKMHDKMYYWHSRFIGGLREMSAERLLERHPEEIIVRAVKGMLPHNTLSEHIIKKLRVFKGSEHSYKAQLGSTKS